MRSLPSLHLLLLHDRLRRLTRFPRLLVFRAKTRIFKSLFSTVIGSTFLSGCLIAIPLCVHYLWEVKNPTEHRQYVSVRLPFLSSPFSCQLFLGILTSLHLLRALEYLEYEGQYWSVVLFCSFQRPPLVVPRRSYRSGSFGSHGGDHVALGRGDRGDESPCGDVRGDQGVDQT